MSRLPLASSVLRPLAAVLALPLLGCPTTTPDCRFEPVLENLQSGGFLTIQTCTGEVMIGNGDAPDAYLAPANVVTPAIAFSNDDFEFSMQQGRYLFDGNFGPWLGVGEGTLTAFNTWENADTRLSWAPGPEGSLNLRVERPGADRISVGFACDPDERWYGWGARPDGTDHTGKSALLYAAEQGIGQQDYGLDEIDILRGRTGDSYFPVPWAVSDKGYGVAVGGEFITQMDLCSESFSGEPELRFGAWTDTLDLFFFTSGSARQAVSDWTLASGPPAEAPSWTWGPWIGVQRGTKELLSAADFLRQNDIPATALWAQDWIGGRENSFGGYDLPYHWEWDEELYPGLPAAIEDLHARGFAFLSYFNPFITEPHEEYEIAQAEGYLPRTPDGDDYTFSIVDRFGSVVDLANPDAWDWALDYMVAAAEMGHDGWMCDFAEWMPFDAVVGDGLSGQDHHNAYPVLWHELNMQALDSVWGEGNALCFGRSGWAGDHRFTPVTWGGDQETSFARDDGIPTAREIGVGLGLSGVGRYGSDIAGFSSVWDGPSTQEVYWRWISMGAFEPVMRTHDGLAEDDNWHWQTDEDTVDHFARYARWHIRLQPLWEMLDREYVDGGLPITRHSLIVTDDLAVHAAPDQHFIGDDLLIAPVLTEGATSRDVVLPAGRWFGLLDDTDFVGPATVSVDAPLDHIPVFARGGSVIPLAHPELETTYEADDATVLDEDLAQDRLDLLAFAGGFTDLVLADGTEVSFAGEEPADGALTFDGDTLPVCDAGRTWNCAEASDAGTIAARVTLAEAGSTLAGEGWSLSVNGPVGRESRIVLRY